MTTLSFYNETIKNNYITMKLFNVHLFYGIAVVVAKDIDEVINLINNDEDLSDSFTDIRGNSFPKEMMLESIVEISGYEATGPTGIIAYYKE